MGHVPDEAHVQHPVGLVQHHRLHLVQPDGAPLHVVHQPPRGGHHDLGPLFQLINLPADGLAAVEADHPDPLPEGAQVPQLIPTHWVDYLDGGRYIIAVPQHKIISNKSVRRDEMYGIYYYDNSNFQGLVNKILIEHYPGDSREILKSIFNDFIIEFNSGTELKKFVNFLDKNVELLKNDKIFPKLVLDRKYEMEDFDAIEYVVAKKIKWLYENRYLKLE